MPAARPLRTGVLLAAGRGERLRPLTDTIPKPALAVAGTPLGAWSLAALLEVADHVIVNLSHLPRVAQRALEPYCPPDRVSFLNEGPRPFGTAGTLRALRPDLAGDAAVGNADVVADLRFASLLATHQEAGLAATVVVAEVSAGADFLVAQGAITGFVDRRHEPDAPGYRYAGFGVMGPEALALIPNGKDPIGLGETVLAPLSRSGALAAHVHRGYLLDVGTPGRYRQVLDDVLVGRAPQGPAQWAQMESTAVLTLSSSASEEKGLDR